MPSSLDLRACRSLGSIFSRGRFPGKWLPESGHAVADATLFERYGESFDPRSGMGGFEIWVSLRA